ncbi:MAG TPA: site-2 protease family protein [Flavobacterium sp.]|nr:site-2 protease family protein [Flavobacterium sp.]
MINNIIPLFILMAFVSHQLLIILHELGHAFIASAFTTKEVIIFIGSYGKMEKNWNFTIGKQRYHIEYNIIFWRGGLCRYEAGEMTLTQKVFQILAGPLFPLVMALAFYYIADKHMGDYAYLFAIALLAVATLSCLVNLFPKQNAVKVKDGYLPNDGYHLLELFRYRKIYTEYNEAMTLYSEKKYAEAGKIFEDFINRGIYDKKLYKLALTACIMGKRLESAKDILNTYKKAYTPDYDDFINIGYFYSQNEEHKLALKYYKKSLKIKKSWYGYNNIGFQLAEMAKYKEAVKYLDKAIEINNHAYVYNNRGLAKIKLGNIEEGLKDIEKSRELDPNNSYYYRSMGIYHFDCKKYEVALDFFEQSKNIDETTLKINTLIAETQNKLKQL